MSWYRVFLAYHHSLYTPTRALQRRGYTRTTMRVPVSLLLAALSLVGSTVAYPFAETEEVLRRESDSQRKADAVKEAFQHAWNGYMKYAYPHDELHPVSNGYGDSR